MAAHRPRKRFGQNFLTDRSTAARIAAVIDPGPGDRLVEVGPGRGALTAPLLERCGTLDAIELDRDLVDQLEALPGPGQHLRLHQADALRFDYGELARERGGPLRLAGNLPYNIATPLLFHLLEQGEAIADMHFMLQREVVDRLAAGPGTKTYGRLSVMVQMAAEVTPLFRVPPGAFYPVPKVDSAVVRLQRRGPDSPRPANPEAFDTLVARAFRTRRKTLRNALAGLCPDETIARAGIDPGVRAETLSVSDFLRLAEEAFGEPKRLQES